MIHLVVGADSPSMDLCSLSFGTPLVDAGCFLFVGWDTPPHLPNSKTPHPSIVVNLI